MPTSISIYKFVVRDRSTYLIYHVDKDLSGIPTEGTDLIAFVLAREDCLNQGGELPRDERAPDQAFASWSIEVKRRGVEAISTLYKTGGRMGEDIPLSATKVVVAPPETFGHAGTALSTTLGFPSVGKLCGLRRLSIS